MITKNNRKGKMTEQQKEKKQSTQATGNIAYRHSMPIQLRFTDADRFGHVSNSVYLQYYDTAKVDYFSKVGAAIFDFSRTLIVAHIEYNFISQVFTTDDVAVESAITHIGHKSVRLSQRLVDRRTGEVKCEGHSVMVCYDMERKETVPVWPQWVEAINAYEGRDLRQQ